MESTLNALNELSSAINLTTMQVLIGNVILLALIIFVLLYHEVVLDKRIKQRDQRISMFEDALDAEKSYSKSLEAVVETSDAIIKELKDSDASKEIEQLHKNLLKDYNTLQDTHIKILAERNNLRERVEAQATIIEQMKLEYQLTLNAYVADNNRLRSMVPARDNHGRFIPKHQQHDIA
jgi:septal ring factor EnvC (AmiA/AmiB activator)